MNNWNRIFKPIVVLGVICVVVTGALAATNSVTGPIITAAIEAAETAARTELLPEADSFTEVKDIAVENVSASLYPTTIAPFTAIGPGDDCAIATRSSISFSSIQWYSSTNFFFISVTIT